MSKRLVIANWKMNPTTAPRAKALFSGVSKVAPKHKTVSVVVCPSFVHLPLLTASYRGASVQFGVQNLHPEESGAYTGEVSPLMAKSAGARFALLGHSERRALGEDNDFIRAKLESALKEKLLPVLCIGEEERTNEGDYLHLLRHQIESALHNVTAKECKKLVVAYEPVWAIGVHAVRAMTSEELFETVLFIRKVLADRYDRKTADGVPILYGGSVQASNTRELIVEGGVNGLLVGSASLDVEEFAQIISSAAGAK